MQKSQRLWLWISSILFILPEIIWSPLTNFIYSLYAPTVNGSTQILRDSFLLDSRFEFLYFFIILIQLLGILIFIRNWMQVKNLIRSKLSYTLILFFSILLGVGTFFIVYLAFAINNISF